MKKKKILRFNWSLSLSPQPLFNSLLVFSTEMKNYYSKQLDQQLYKIIHKGMRHYFSLIS